jgi:hypothetical protein
MERVIRKFDSFEAAEAAEIEEDRAMTPEQRIEIVLELQARVDPDGAKQGFQRVYRVVEREQR